jgi:hypothetical protein
MTPRIKAVLGVAASFTSALVVTIAPATPVMASTTWLDRLNAWRAISNLPPVTENTTWDAGDVNHSIYMVKNQLITHYEDPSLPYYTAAGDTEARNSNIEVSSTTATQDWQAIDWWMAAPFHEMGMEDPLLATSGYGADREVVSGWQAGFALDVLQGRTATNPKWPVYFPGNGSTEPLTSYNGGEFPDPLQACPGYSAPTGLPITIQVGSNVGTTVTAHSLTANGAPIAHCAIDSTNAAVGSSLTYRGGVIVIPQQPLQPGTTYVVALTVNGVPYTWSFKVSTTGAMVPGPVSNVVATAGDTTATVTWTAPSDTGGTAVISYVVTPYIGGTAQASQTVTAPTTTATFSGLTDGTTYWFSVAATNSIGTGPTVDSYSVTPSSTAAPPARMTAVSTQQYRLLSSDGATWQDVDGNNLSLSFTPATSEVAIISANADLWTANAGFNQDIGIWLKAGGAAGAVLAWKESGGFAGTFSPNAAMVQTAIPVAAGTTYSVKLDWKTNKPALGATIFAGAGPVSSQYSPTRLTVRLVPSSGYATASSVLQYTLPNSDGATWMRMDAANLVAPLTPTAAGVAVVTANADLWTANSGVNQDLGVFVSVNGGADQLVAWKESGGFAGTFSPNAAFVQATWPVSAGSTYLFKLEWKANRNAPGATIFAGAGPIGGLYSPTRLTVVELPAASMASASSVQQYSLPNSDGAAWQSIDQNALKLTFTPGATAAYVVSGNADLWTAYAGFNQDLGVYISGGAFASPTLVAWKESGGFGGTFSPNAAYVETVVNLQASTPYAIWLVWKTNSPASGATIYAAAGPLPSGGSFSPTRLTVIPQ